MNPQQLLARLLRVLPERFDAALVTGVGSMARLGVVAWAWNRFPPADDGHFYHIVADRIARGLGYTWLWPDGAVTYAAHYPVGYPALLATFYALFGSLAGVAMLMNAALGTLGVWSVFRLAQASGRRGAALGFGLVMALHPGLVFYTPAVMTEGVTASLLAMLALLSSKARERSGFSAPALALSLLSGLAVLIRPQTLLLIPLFGAFSSKAGGLTRWGRALLTTALCVCVCLPWTLRNCERLDRCVFVSANGGWNLYIGSAEKATGTWVALDQLGVPPECRTVFAEAEKDRCFGGAGYENLLQHPGRWLRLVPAKLAATFDWSGAAGHYLKTANLAAFSETAALAVGIAEALVTRTLLLFGLFGVGWSEGPRPRVRRVLALLAMPWLFVRSAWVAYLLLIPLTLLLGRLLWQRASPLFAAGTIFVTAAVHATFFGAGRYGLVCVPLLVALATEAFRFRDSRESHPPERRPGPPEPPEPRIEGFDRQNPGGGY